MDDFVNFIVDYIEKTEIHGNKGWIDQLLEYRWKNECFCDGIQTSKKLKAQTDNALKIPDAEVWSHHCKEITKWGGMLDVPLALATRYRESVNYLLNNDPGVKSDFSTLSISGERIATASKIYYFSDPLRWTIYDSRVGYAIHQLIFEYANELKVLPSTLFSEIPFCLPDSKTDRRKPVYPIQLCTGSETRSKASFIWASHLHRLIAKTLNESSLTKPAQHFSVIPQWELPHIEMVFFVIGDRKWIKATSKTEQSPQIKFSKRGEYAGTCPLCGSPLKYRESRVTGELYDGCTNFPACKYKGNRSH
jgi:hypothetical protein